MSSEVLFKLVESPRGAVLSVLVDGELEVLDDSHPNFVKVVELVRQGEQPDANLFSLAKAVAQRFQSLSERVSVAGGRVYFDGDEIDNALTQHIVRLLEANVKFTPFVRFLEKVSTNPDTTSREQLYTWLNARSFTITDDGDFLAYKGVNPGESLDGKETFYSVHAGKAIVDGELINGHVPQWEGAVVEMPRSEVHNDPRRGCSTGLHVATFDFARSFVSSGVVLVLRVNPRDVVSVPTESGQAKVRVCRYVVDRVTTVEYDGPVYDADLDDELDDELDDFWGDGEGDEYYGDSEDETGDDDYTTSPNPFNVPPVTTTTTVPQVLDVTSSPLNSQAKLTWTDVDAIRESHAAGISIESLADNYGVSRRAVQRVVSNQSWV